MARSIFTDTVGGRAYVLLLLTIIATTITSTHGFSLELRSSDSCPSSYDKCGSSKLPDDFCCSSSSTCISLDDASSAICCPKGQSCNYIEPITCDVQLQNATLHPKNPVKTTKLDDDLPKCGDACCPFGYTCQGNSTCAIDQDTSSTATSSASSMTSTFSTSTKTSSSSVTSTTSSQTSTATEASSTDSDPPTTITATTPSSSASGGISTISANSLESVNSKDNSNSTVVSGKCPSYPSAAVAAGFFPGAIFGAVLALLVTFCLKRRRESQNLPPSVKVYNNTKRSSNGTLIGISDPIPSDDTSFRTDFLLQTTNQKRTSDGARSVLQRTRSRAKSLFGATPKVGGRQSRPPPLPLPVNPRQPSTESIKVYTPPGVLVTNGLLKPAPYPLPRPDTTFSELINSAGPKNNKGEPSPGIVTEGSKSGLRTQQNV